MLMSLNETKTCAHSLLLFIVSRLCVLHLFIRQHSVCRGGFVTRWMQTKISPTPGLTSQDAKISGYLPRHRQEEKHATSPEGYETLELYQNGFILNQLSLFSLAHK